MKTLLEFTGKTLGEDPRTPLPTGFLDPESVVSVEPSSGRKSRMRNRNLEFGKIQRRKNFGESAVQSVSQKSTHNKV